ncbi:MAG: universal stress protein [Candidatus Nanopelagicales bacterium]|jgi:nucleotide-binding universal stress UspA family protein
MTADERRSIVGSGVVVGYDGSEHSSIAIDWAADEAVSRGLPLTLVAATTIPLEGMRFGGSVLSPDAIDDLLERLRAGSEARADEVRAAHADLNVTVKVALGSPASVLVEASANAQLVVLGSRGMGGFRGLLVGSVGVQVASSAACPVVIIRKPASESATTIVVGVDGSELSLAALDFAFDMADRRGWSVRAVHAWEVPAYDVIAAPSGPPPFDVEELAAAEHRAFAESLAGQRERHPGVTVEEVVAKGPSARAILAASADAALIALGTRGRGEFLGALLGSVSQGVLHRAKVPVAVIGPEEGS